MIGEDAEALYLERYSKLPFGFYKSYAEKQLQKAIAKTNEAERANIAFTAVVKTSLVAAKTYSLLNEKYPGEVVLEPLEVVVSNGRLVSRSLQGPEIAPTPVVVDLFLYSVPMMSWARADGSPVTFADRLFPIVTIRSGPGLGSKPFELASDGINYATPDESGGVGYTFVDYIGSDRASAAAFAGSEGSNSGLTIVKGGQPLSRDVGNIYALEQLPIETKPWREYLENKSPVDPVRDAWLAPLGSRVIEVLQQFDATTVSEVQLETYGRVLFGERQDALRARVGDATYLSIVKQALESESKYLSGASGQIAELTVNSDFGKSVQTLLLEETKLVQRQRTTETIMLVTALVGGAAIGALGAAGAATQGATNALQGMILATSSNLQRQLPNFSRAFGKLMVEQRTAFDVVVGDGRTVRAESLGQLRAEIRKTVFEAVGLPPDAPLPAAS